MRDKNVCTIVLDTSPVRELAHTIQTPVWVDQFSMMSNDGYLFSLSDEACAELINQRQRGSTKDHEFERLIDCLTKFIDHKLPIMPGLKDILVEIGAASHGPDDHDISHVSQLAWSKLSQGTAEADIYIEGLLEEARSEYKQTFNKLGNLLDKIEADKALDEYDHIALDSAFKSLDAQSNVSPSMSVRLDLATRYLWRQFCRSRRESEPYNVDARKNRNDGIDYQLYFYMALPALVVSKDRGFFGSIEDIPSFQTKWFYRPSDLANAWVNGGRPQPVWP